uniref:Nucleoside phosphorylase domain-containing protein n=1 Tax=Triticum urartu TaxID=4572 RepID=A0A8R7UZ81_TRIUA
MAMELSRLPLVLLLCLLASSSTTALPALAGMDRVRQQVDRANRHGPSIGLVMSYVAEDTALQASGYFRPWRVQPFVDLYGRRFHIGSIRGVNVIYALTGQRRLNAAVTVQTLLDVFTVSGIVHYGTAGSSNDSMSFGDVSVPKLVAYTGAWTWKVPSYCN